MIMKIIAGCVIGFYLLLAVYIGFHLICEWRRERRRHRSK
jgi:hypothetical protein